MATRLIIMILMGLDCWNIILKDKLYTLKKKRYIVVTSYGIANKWILYDVKM